MLKTVRTYINALTEGKLSSKIKLYKKNTNNPIPLDRESREMQNIDKLTGELRISNLKVYTKEMAKVALKKAAFLTPIYLGSLTFFSGVNTHYVAEIIPHAAYEETTLEFDEESIYSESKTIYAQTFFRKEYVDDSIVSFGSIDSIDLSSNTIIYYGEGSASLQVNFNINDDYTWEYVSHTNNLFEKSQVKTPEQVRVTDEEYISLIREATETFIKKAELSDEEINYVRELVNNNENDILVRIKRYTTLDDIVLEANKRHSFRTFIGLVATITAIIYLIKKFTELTTCKNMGTSEVAIGDEYVPRLYTTNGRTRNSYDNLLDAANSYREMYLNAENARLTSIINILEENGGEERIIKNYNKRLSLLPPKKGNQ